MEYWAPQKVPALPDPSNFDLPPFPDSVVAIRVPEDGLTLFRLVRSNPATVDPDFKWHSLAWAATGKVSELLRVAFSTYLTPDSAYRVARLGSYVAELRVKPHVLVHIARTGRFAGGDHVSVWAPPELLMAAIVAYAGPKRTTG